MNKSINEYSKIVFFGGGVLAERLYKQINSIDSRLVGVFDLLDDRRVIKEFKGFSITNASNILDLLENQEIAVLVAIGHYDVYKIVDKLLLTYPFIADRLFIVNPYSSLRFFMVDDDLASEERIPFSSHLYEKVRELFKDQESICHFDLLVNSKPFENNNDDYEIISYKSLGDMYYYSENYWNTFDFSEKRISMQATILDCGAYIGDSVESICNAIPSAENYYYAFEPLKTNVCKMKANSRLFQICEEFNIFECGVGEEDKQLFFHLPDNGVEIGGRFIDNPEGAIEKLEIRKIDDLDINYRGTVFLKMDIEGAELSALKGAENLIKERNPYMAICLYHRKNDLINIPLFIDSISSNYDFYLRGGYHTILWAIPR